MNQLNVDQQLSRSVPGWKTGSEDLSRESRRATVPRAQKTISPSIPPFHNFGKENIFDKKAIHIIFEYSWSSTSCENQRNRNKQTNKQDKTKNKKNENLIYMFSEKTPQKDHFQVHFSYFGFNFEQTRTCNSNKHIDQQLLAIMVFCRRKNSRKTN